MYSEQVVGEYVEQRLECHDCDNTLVGNSPTFDTREFLEVAELNLNWYFGLDENWYCPACHKKLLAWRWKNV